MKCELCIVIQYFCLVEHPKCGVGEFQCYNGQCVDISMRCNLIPDCQDASDEHNCGMYMGYL